MTWQLAQVAGSLPRYDEPFAYSKAYAPRPRARPAAAASAKGMGRTEVPRLFVMWPAPSQAARQKGAGQGAAEVPGIRCAGPWRAPGRWRSDRIRGADSDAGI